jgi:protein-disulfide isomerase/uncharacterized membrane protein
MSFSIAPILAPSFTEHDNLLGVAWAYARTLQVPITLTTLRDKLTAHPHYPSLLSVADVFDQLNIENAALRIDAEQLAVLEVPYIAHLRKNGGYFVVVENTTPDTVAYRDHKHQQTTESRDEFLKKWSGVVFIAEPNEASGEKDYPDKHQKEQLESLRWPIVLSIFGLITALGMYQSADLQMGLLLGLKAIGVILASLLLSVQYGKTNDFTDSLCHLNQKTDCNHILTSQAAKITDWLGWSEVGLFYFLGGWISLILSTLTLRGSDPSVGTAITPLLVLSALALPYTFWSISYQWRVAKQWCPLCVAVQVVIWAECLSFLLSSPLTLQGWEISTEFVAPLLGAGGAVIALWLIIKPFLQKSKHAESLERELKKFRNNPVLFEALLSQQKQMPPIPADLQLIILGNPTAEHTITMVTNPYCSPCADAHAQLEEVLAENPQVKAQIVFAVCRDFDGRRTKVAKHMLALASLSLPLEGKGLREGVAAWYAQTNKDYDKWAKAYPADISMVSDEVVAAHCDWTQLANIDSTPTFFVDGYKMPQVYGLKQSTSLLVHLEQETAQ